MHRVRGWASWQFHLQPPNLTSNIFATSWLTRIYSTSFERSYLYLFGVWSPRLWLTFNRFYLGSKYPYFISYRDKWMYLFCRGCTLPKSWIFLLPTIRRRHLLMTPNENLLCFLFPIASQLETCKQLFHLKLCHDPTHHPSRKLNVWKHIFPGYNFTYYY